MDEDEAKAMFDAMGQGKKYIPPKQITDYPQGGKDWCKDNADKINESHDRGKDPYFVRHNFDVVKQAIKGEEITAPKTELISLSENCIVL